jgi:pimeloyl-ACP methyl ester carboxylesterase
MKLKSDIGGDGGRLLVLLHGLGATRHVWQPMLLLDRWNGCWMAPDLRGHGASARATNYSLARHADDVAALVRSGGNWDEIVIVGHSMGGAIALAMASGSFGVRPSRVFGLGIKVAWTGEEETSLRGMATTPVRQFATKGEAVARYLKLSGLLGLVEPSSIEADAGVAQTADGWRLAFDPASASVGAPPMQALMAAARAPVHLACGEEDVMVTREQLAAFDPEARELPGGHSAMVEQPGAAWDWIDEKLS